LVKKCFNNLYLRLDIWDNYAQSASDTRSGVIGVTSIAGICGSQRYSIVEYAGLNSIQNSAHELGHKLVSIEIKIKTKSYKKI
jgi:hypothetical protein